MRPAQLPPTRSPSKTLWDFCFPQIRSDAPDLALGPSGRQWRGRGHEEEGVGSIFPGRGGWAQLGICTPVTGARPPLPVDVR